LWRAWLTGLSALFESISWNLLPGKPRRGRFRRDARQAFRRPVGSCAGSRKMGCFAMTGKLLAFLALVLTALALVPGGAHLFALPNKLPLDQQGYFAVQGIYRGWALLGGVQIAALLADLGLALAVRRRRGAGG